MNLCGKAGNTLDNVTLIGMPGSGKSTVGVLLAKLLGYQFLDVDLLIQEREGALLQEILDSRGTAAFLDAEERAVLSLDCRRTVIAPGGSAVCREGAARRLQRLGPVVYLNVPLEELTKRVQNLSTRGIAMEPGRTLPEPGRPWPTCWPTGTPFTANTPVLLSTVRPGRSWPAPPGSLWNGCAGPVINRPSPQGKRGPRRTCPSAANEKKEVLNAI